jgi:Tol biopolymer transport system component
MSARRGLFVRVLSSVAATLLLGTLIVAAPHEAAAVKLNPSLVPGGSVLEAQLTPNGSRVVYRADQEANGRVELYSVPVNGGTPVKLNGPLVAGGSVSAFQITPDGNRVVFLADQDLDGLVEIFSVPVSGGAPVRLNDELMFLVVGSVGVTSFQLTSTGDRVVFLADQDTAGHFELFSVPVAGGARAKLNGPEIVLGGSVIGYEIAPNNSRVVFRGDIEDDNLIELFSAPIAGGALVKLNPPLTEDVVSFQVTPDSSGVVYRAAQDNEDVVELYVVPIAGGGATKLNGALPADFEVSNFQITPDGSRVVFRARREISQPPPADDIVTIEIYSVPVAGGAMVKLNGALVAGGSVSDFKIAPNSSRVVYLADQEVDTRFELYSVPVQGGTVTKLNPALVANGDVSGDVSGTTLLDERPQFTPDSSRVVYRADQAADQVFELFSVPVGGGAAVRLNPTLLAGRDVFAFEISPDGSRVVYLADQDDNGTNELYSVPITGGTRRRR